MEQKPLEPVDLKRCQADVPGNGPFTMGGEIGNPKDGYRVRCKNEPTVIATENQPGEDGRIGSMSLCRDCVVAFIRLLGAGHATLRDIMDPDACLKEMLELAEEVVEPGGYKGDGAAGDYTSDAARLAELAQSLDGWINSGGFLPKRWVQGTKEESCNDEDS